MITNKTITPTMAAPATAAMGTHIPRFVRIISVGRAFAARLGDGADSPCPLRPSTPGPPRTGSPGPKSAAAAGTAYDATPGCELITDIPCGAIGIPCGTATGIPGLGVGLDNPGDVPACSALLTSVP